MKNNKISQMMLASMLCAIGIIIPLFSPIKVVIEPASFTLASHVAIMIAMFLSPGITATVCIGTTIGFFFGGFPITVVARAASHLIFALIGSYALTKKPDLIQGKKFIAFTLVLSLIHAACEVIVVMPFFFSGADTSNFLYSIIVLVGVGTVVHSMVDFMIARAVYQVVPAKYKAQVPAYQQA